MAHNTRTRAGDVQPNLDVDLGLLAVGGALAALHDHPPAAQHGERGAADPPDRRGGELGPGGGHQLAHQLGLGINAGHDLDLDNLKLFRRLPHLDEVSIGHAIISRAIFVGLEKVVREYLERLREG